MNNFVRFLFLAFFVFLLALGYAIRFVYAELYAVSPKLQEASVTLEIPEGMYGQELIDKLTTEGVVTQPCLLKVLFWAKPELAKVQAGEYVIPQGSSLFSVVTKDLRYPLSQDVVRVTFPEGLTLVQVADVLEKSDLVSAQDFIDIASKKGSEFGDFPDNLEGYLFPETYDFALGSSCEDIIRRMTLEFRERFEPLYLKRDKNISLTPEEYVVLASLVERETQVDSERSTVAGVYLNRLAVGQKLECDATIQYALGKQKAVLTYKDLETDSPYNSYRYAGLPPGPIANPGESCLKAALNPKKTDYFYYVRNDEKGDGSHVFSKTYAEHEEAIERYLYD